MPAKGDYSMVPVSGDPAQGTVRVTQRIYFAHAAVMNRRRALQIDSPCLAYECLSHPPEDVSNKSTCQNRNS